MKQRTWKLKRNTHEQPSVGMDTQEGSSQVHEAEKGTGRDSTRRAAREEASVCTTMRERNLRQVGEHLQEARSTPCVPTDEDLEEPAHKSERTEETCRHGVPDPLRTVRRSLHWRDREATDRRQGLQSTRQQ